MKYLGWDDGKVWSERSNIAKWVPNRPSYVKLEHTAKITRLVMLPVLYILIKQTFVGVQSNKF